MQFRTPLPAFGSPAIKPVQGLPLHDRAIQSNFYFPAGITAPPGFAKTGDAALAIMTPTKNSYLKSDTEVTGAAVTIGTTACFCQLYGNLTFGHVSPGSSSHSGPPDHVSVLASFGTFPHFPGGKTTGTPSAIVTGGLSVQLTGYLQDHSPTSDWYGYPHGIYTGDAVSDNVMVTQYPVVSAEGWESFSWTNMLTSRYVSVELATRGATRVRFYAWISYSVPIVSTSYGVPIAHLRFDISEATGPNNLDLAFLGSAPSAGFGHFKTGQYEDNTSRVQLRTYLASLLY